jgi:hypothetical protein
MTTKAVEEKGKRVEESRGEEDEARKANLHGNVRNDFCGHRNQIKIILGR